MRNILIVLVVILWIIVGVWFYQISKKCCNDQSSVEKTEEQIAPVVEEAAEITGPLLYNWSDKSPIFGDGWNAMKNDLRSRVNESNHLLITGYYDSDETNETSFDNLGLARADSLRRSEFADVPEDQVRLAAEQRTVQESNRNGLYESAKFDVLRQTKNIKQTANSTTIYFPYNSAKELNAGDVRQYLDEVAERVNSSGERVRLTGHTDSYGDNNSNMALGRKRAAIIRDYLVEKGVNNAKILLSSKGEESPIASNETKDGRAKNRRTELQIIK